jgi:hypothetical protein
MFMILLINNAMSRRQLCAGSVKSIRLLTNALMAILGNALKNKRSSKSNKSSKREKITRKSYNHKKKNRTKSY